MLPACPSEANPVVNPRDPLDALVAVPVDNLTGPEASELAELIVTDPLDVAIPIPLRILTEPPV
jgi:hypothetical protein